MNLPELTSLALIGFLVLLPLGLYLEVRARPERGGSDQGSPTLRDLGRSLTALACVPISLVMLSGESAPLVAALFLTMAVYYADASLKTRRTSAP